MPEATITHFVAELRVLLKYQIVWRHGTKNCSMSYNTAHGKKAQKLRNSLKVVQFMFELLLQIFIIKKR